MRKPLTLQPCGEEWKPRFVTVADFPRREATPPGDFSLPTDGDGTQLRAKTSWG